MWRHWFTYGTAGRPAPLRKKEVEYSSGSCGLVWMLAPVLPPPPPTTGQCPASVSLIFCYAWTVRTSQLIRANNYRAEKYFDLIIYKYISSQYYKMRIKKFGFVFFWLCGILRYFLFFTYLLRLTKKFYKFVVLYCIVKFVAGKARICKRLRSPGIDSKESIPPAYVGCSSSTGPRQAT
jgi:hypothetical protein